MVMVARMGSSKWGSRNFAEKPINVSLLSTPNKALGHPLLLKPQFPIQPNRRMNLDSQIGTQITDTFSRQVSRQA